MGTTTFERSASVTEIAAEMDRRGAVIETIEADLARLRAENKQLRAEFGGANAEAAAADWRALRAENEVLRTERDNSRANSVSRGKKLIRLRNKIIEISNHIEHEGDRAYFGSTNHADELREIFLWLDGFKWDRVMAESDEDDLLSSVERLLARAAAAEAKAARLETALRYGAQLELPEMLEWVADRFEHVYGESPNIDFVLTLRERAKLLRAALEAKP